MQIIDNAYIGIEKSSKTIPTTQVYKVTHNGAGNRLPLMNRSFISFTFGGKYIEDFNLIATFTSNGLERDGFASFNDLISNYDVLEGQYYWGTHYGPNTLDFTLSTDGIEQTQLDEFLRWFAAGQTRELILAEHPNRALMTRVKSAPELSLVPFEQHAIVMIGGRSYTTSTTVYRGDIKLSLESDEPHWYAKTNLFGKKAPNSDDYFDTWIDANGKERNVLEDPDAIKIILEDGIPTSSMIKTSVLLGGDVFANYSSENAARVGYARVGVSRIGGTKIESIIGLTLPNQEEENSLAYLYYAGTAPTKPTLEFILTPIIDSNFFITNPKNKHSEGIQYNTITLRSINTKKFSFTTPSMLTGYNQVIEIFDEGVGKAWPEIRLELREKVKHMAPRAWATRIIDYLENSSSEQLSAATSQIELAKQLMTYFIKDKDNNLFDIKFVIDSKTGSATGTFKYRIPTTILPSNEEDWSEYGNIKTSIEDTGDMIRSNYLIIEDRNFPNGEGNIVAWANLSDETKAYSHVIYHDVENGLKGIFIKYKNMYL